MRALATTFAICVACVGDSGDPPPTFTGNWSCDITQNLTINGTPQSPDESTDPVIISAPSAGELLIDDQNGEGDCTFTASFSGGSASVTGGTCTQNDGQGDTAKITFTGGSFQLDATGATLSGNTTSSVMGVFSGSSATGTDNATFTCTR